MLALSSLSFVTGMLAALALTAFVRSHYAGRIVARVGKASVLAANLRTMTARITSPNEPTSLYELRRRRRGEWQLRRRWEGEDRRYEEWRPVDGTLAYELEIAWRPLSRRSEVAHGVR